MKYEVACTFCGHNQIYSPRSEKIPKKPHTTCKSCNKDFSIDISISENVPRIPKNTKPTLLKNKDQKPAIFDTPNFITDPNELLMSCAMRELNKSNPEVRWATILLNVLDKTKQLQTKTSSDTLSKLKQYSTQEMINLRKKLIGSSQDVG